MNGLFSKTISFVVLILTINSVQASELEKCPQTLMVTASGVQSTILPTKQIQYQLQLFASETPNLASLACMSFPGSCTTCFYHDNQLPQDNTRIHSLNYRPAVSFVVDGQTISDKEVSWMNLVIAANSVNIPFGIYLNSFSTAGVVIKAEQAPYILQQAELVDANCKPTVVADAEQPCATINKTIGTIQSIQIK